MKYLLILLCTFVLIDCRSEPNEEILINANLQGEYKIGKEKGIIPIETDKSNDGTFDHSDIDSNTEFNIELKTDSENTYALKCRLWIGNQENPEILVIFCNFQESLKADEEKINSKIITATATYKSYNLKITINISNLSLEKCDYYIPFLYSAPITINVNGQKTFSFKFKIDSYNNEPLFIRVDEYIVLPFEKCEKNSNILECQISKEKFDIVANENNDLIVLYLNEFEAWGYKFEYVSSIQIKYPAITKENIVFELKQLQESIVDTYTYVTFSTNITNIPKLKTKNFKLYFGQISVKCHFIKHETSTPLYLTCRVKDAVENFQIEEIDGFTKDNIHYKYNFILGPGTNNDNITVIDARNTHVIQPYPEVLDFSKSDSVDVYFIMGEEHRMKNTTLNADKGPLECVETDFTQKCKVPKSHFDGKEGYYLIHRKNSRNEWSTHYESFGVKVTFSGSGNSGTFSKFSLGLFALLYLLVL